MLRRLGGRWRRLPLRARLTLGLGVVAVVVLAPVLVFAVPWGGAGPCNGFESREFGCYETYLASIVKEDGGEAANAELTRMSQESSYVLSRCHVLAHSIGHADYDVYGSVEEAVKHADGTCWSGVYHGIYEIYMSQFDDADLRRIVPTICKQPANDPYAFDYYNCLHGIGHGVVIRFDDDVFQGLPYCDLLEGSWERSSCYTGAFMQNVISDASSHQSPNLRPEDPMYPCDAVEDQYKNACYLGQTSYALKVIGYDYERGFELCDAVEPDYVSTCYRSMGRDISGNSHRDAQKVLELCSLGDPDLQGQCFAGAARNAVFHDHGTVNADALCAIVPERYADQCIRESFEAAE